MDDGIPYNKVPTGERQQSLREPLHTVCPPERTNVVMHRDLYNEK